MKRMLLCLALLCLMGGNALADVLYIDAGNADRVHLREEASSDSKSYGLYFSGTPVEAKAQIGDFTVVSIFMENGFIKTEYLTADPSGIDSALRVGTVHTGAGYINMRKYAGDSPVIMTVPDGDTVTVMGETASGWYYVAYGGQHGYMKRSLVRLGGPAAQSTLRETLDLQAGGSRITAELHETAGGEFEREYRIRFLQNGTEIAAAGFLGDSYAHLRHFESDAGSPVMRVTDVNMDGHADVSVIRYTGATDAQAAHFLFDPQMGTFERHRELDALSWWRCTLYPQTKMMLNYVRDGAACGTWTLLRWQGMALETVAVGRISYADASGETLRASVMRGGEVTYAQTWREPDDGGSAWQRQLEAMLAALWGGAEPGEAWPMGGGGL